MPKFRIALPEERIRRGASQDSQSPVQVAVEQRKLRIDGGVIPVHASRALHSERNALRRHDVEDLLDQAFRFKTANRHRLQSNGCTHRG